MVPEEIPGKMSVRTSWKAKHSHKSFKDFKENGQAALIKQSLVVVKEILQYVS